MLWIHISIGERSVVLFTNKADRHDIAEILLKVSLNLRFYFNILHFEV
jgi:hypothetical protein